MDRVLFAEPFKRAPFVTKVKRRIAVDKYVMRFGLALNALVVSIIIYAEFFLR